MIVITPPASEPVTVSEVKAQLGITDINSDSIIGRRITQAREWAENYTRRALITQTREIRLDGFALELELPGAPVQSIVKIEYVDVNGSIQVVASTDYVMDVYDGVLRLAYGKSWPSCRGERNAVRVQYICGYGLAAAVPGLIREAIMMIVGHWTNQQQQSESGVVLARIPFAVRDILDTYTVARY